MPIAAVICLAAAGFITDNPRQSRTVHDFVSEHRAEIDAGLAALPAADRTLALAVVSPELSQYSTFLNAMEMRTLFIMYRQSGAADFSVGYFQMKPAFVEYLETMVRKTPSLKAKYSDILPAGSVKEQREFRLERLAGLNGQLRYLCVFIEVAKMKTAKIAFKSTEEKLKYWATLYNSGLGLSHAKVLKFQKRKLFPKYGTKYNYADVAYEFYKSFTSPTP